MSEEAKTYNPETYWSEVGKRIQQRGDGNVVAGDDTPYYRYKRERFLEMLNSVNFRDKKVMEIGHGPGGNLAEVLKHNPSQLTGVDISDTMISLAKENLGTDKIEFYKTDGMTIGYPDQSQEVVFSATVLQHNSDEEMMKAMFREMLRVSSDQVIIFERIEKQLKGDDLCVGRPSSYYAAVAESEGFKLKEATFINIQASYLVCGAIRKLFNPGSRKEGEKLNGFSVFMQKATLPITKVLDKVFTAKRDLGKLVFERTS
ncbi:class I SAM-dependent methyltransferase [Portibacter lacus]|uniref:Methyltransferase domain-containing protein n=1 Tax=Portibacter lacus TaxID=1099794 RepID=A0AA37WE98_9BACT|nr:methyltransferase domain-containing protein [Portibacter lacus]GLR17773.1 hypothetical protein GCM10007940_23880 [Portibacter lacus]